MHREHCPTPGPEPASAARGIAALWIVALSACGVGRSGVALDAARAAGGPRVVEVMPDLRAVTTPDDADGAERRRRFRALAAGADSAWYWRVTGDAADGDLDAYLRQLGALAPAVDTLRARLPSLVGQAWRRLVAALPDARADRMTVYLLPSRFAFDGQARPSADSTVVMFGLDATAASTGARTGLAPVLHELAHAHHFDASPTVRAGAAGFFDEGRIPPLAGLLWAEGFATYASWRLAPDAPAREVFHGDDVVARASPRLRALAAELRAKQSSTDPADLHTFFLRRGEAAGRADVPPKAGYYVGYCVARLVVERSSLAEAARLDGTALWRAVDEALAVLATSTGAGVACGGDDAR